MKGCIIQQLVLKEFHFRKKSTRASEQVLMQTASMKKKTSDEITKTTFKKLWGWLTYPD